MDNPTRVVYSATKKIKIYLHIINTVNTKFTSNAYLLRKQPLIFVCTEHFVRSLGAN